MWIIFAVVAPVPCLRLVAVVHGAFWAFVCPEMGDTCWSSESHNEKCIYLSPDCQELF